MLGVIVAGGASSRMGRDKALVEVGGRAMAMHVAAALDEVCDVVVLSGRNEGLAGLAAIPDMSTGRRGPLAGLAAVASRFPGEPLILVGVDQPWVRAETLTRLAAMLAVRPVVPVESGVRQTLCAAYPAGLGDLAAEELDGGGSIQSLLDVTASDVVTSWHEWGEDGRSWFSVDSPGDIDEGLRRFGPPH